MEICDVIDPDNFKDFTSEIRNFHSMQSLGESNQLPLRIHIKNNLQGEILSYGCILVHKNKDSKDFSVLVARRRDSVDYTGFICGDYTLAGLPALIFGITEAERERLRSKKFTFNQLFRDLYFAPDKNSEMYKMAERKFRQNIDLALYLMDKIPSSEIAEKNRWIFPKGKQNYINNMKEDPFECAKREFEEETHGMKLDNCLILNKVMEEKFNALNCKVYKTLYFVAKTDNLLELSKVKGDVSEVKESPISEINKVEWIKFSEAKERLIPRKVRILEEISKCL